MRRTRARLLALAVVAGSALGSAYANQVGSGVKITSNATGSSGSGSGMLVISPDPVLILPPPNSSVSSPAMVSTTNPATTMLVAEGLSGTDLSAYKLQDCGGATSCSGLTFPLTATQSYTLQVICDLSIQATPPPAMLTVMDDTGDMATAGVMCGSGSGSGSGSGIGSGVPTLVVDKASINFGSVSVNMSAGSAFTISNGDPSSVLDSIVVSVGGTDPGEFSTNALCTSASPCSIGVGGPAITIPVTFTPNVHGPADATVSITSNGGNASVALSGTGLGAVMGAPSPADLDFGTIPLGQTFMRTVSVPNSGNVMMPVTFTQPAAPYTVAPLVQDVPAMSSMDWTVTCGSASPSPNNDQTIAINSTDPPTYQGAMQSLTVHCAIADTMVQVQPTMLDFGEVRVGTSVAPITVTITNPSTAVGAANLTSVKLDSTKTGLSLSPATTSQTLNPGDVAIVMLQLDTSTETDLTGEFLDVMVDGQSLQFAVTGKVVTARSRIAPGSLQLGTACVGTQVSGTVMLINSGTATLLVQKPTTDSAFTALAQSPMTYPTGGAKLAAGTSATTAVVPSASATGNVTGELVWTDDVPSDYHVPITLDYVANGTAVSPAALDYGSVEVGQPSGSQQITAQNCELSPKPFRVRALRGKEGTAPIGAWKIDPAVGFTTMLGAHDTQVITVHFDPPGRGHYEADLELDTDVGPQTVHLVGDGTGRDFDRTSVYACACNGGDISGGWPIALAIILVRRRRGSSSPR